MYTQQDLRNPRELLKDPRNGVALEKAMNPNTLPRKVEELSHSREPVVRLFAALNPNASMHTLAHNPLGMLYREEDEQVLQAVKSNIFAKTLGRLARR